MPNRPLNLKLTRIYCGIANDRVEHKRWKDSQAYKVISRKPIFITIDDKKQGKDTDWTSEKLGEVVTNVESRLTDCFGLDVEKLDRQRMICQRKREGIDICG